MSVLSLNINITLVAKHTQLGLCKLYDKCPIPFWRKSSVAETLDHIRYEDEQTHYIDIGPVR